MNALSLDIRMAGPVRTARARSWRLALPGLLVSLALTACSAIPDAGPPPGAIEQGATAPTHSYALIDLDPHVARAVAAYVVHHRIKPPAFLPPGRRAGAVGPGDLLQIAIWEPDPSGTSLVADKSGLSFATRVGTDGTIGVPYVGRIHAAGHTPTQIEQIIAGQLAGSSPGAQDAVLVTQDVTNDVIVQGDVPRPGRYPVIPGSSRILDLLALAGGPHTPAQQTLVRITRGNTSVTRSLGDVIRSRQLDTDLAPGDRILVEPRTRYYYAFGAVNQPGEQLYNPDHPSLAHTLARLRGLSDNRADPASVFIYRRQSAVLTKQLAPGQSTPRAIYRLNLRDPDGFFVSQVFPVRPHDIIYVSDAPIAEAAKALQVLTGISNIGAVPRNLGANY